MNIWFFISEFLFYLYICSNYSTNQNIWWFILKKFKNYGILIILQILKFWGFAIFWNCKIWKIFRIFNKKFFRIFNKKIFRIFQITNFWNFPNSKCFEFPKLQIFRIPQFANFEWVSKFWTTKCRTIYISKFQNFEY